MSKKGKFGVLVTKDKLYYVIPDRLPFTIKEDVIKFAEKLNKSDKAKLKKLVMIKQLIKKVKDNPKENPVNAWFIHNLETILNEK